MRSSYHTQAQNRVKEIADDLGIHENLLYNWRRKYTADGDKTKYATLEEENRALRRGTRGGQNGA